MGAEYLECDVKRERWTGSGLYGALDNFGRVVDDVWVKDLGTDRAIYDVDLVYDRNSNIVRLDDHVHPTKFDAVYTMDNLDRLVDAQEGDLNGGSTIATEARQQTWTLTQTGNWANEELDLDGDGTFVDADEHDDSRVHNEVNELEERDLDSNPGTTGDNYALVYDEAGNLIDDGEAYKYEYDCFYRLRKIYDQADDLVAEYRYNGLGYRIAEHVDTDTDGDVDGSDAWHHFAHDERWRVVAMFINGATDPEEQYVHHGAGADGRGSASYIDELVLRDRDAVTDINNALDERLYYLQNRHFDVVALVDDTGKQVEMVRYSAYGVPFGLPGGDCDSDGDCDAGDTTDTDQIQTWINGSVYDVRGDMDLDGDVDAADEAIASATPFTSAAVGRGQASSTAFTNRFIWLGYLHDTCAGTTVSARTRSCDSVLGRWHTRDSLRYRDGINVYAAMKQNPIRFVDPFGTTSGDGMGETDFYDVACAWERPRNIVSRFCYKSGVALHSSSIKVAIETACEDYWSQWASAECERDRKCMKPCKQEVSPVTCTYITGSVIPAVTTEDLWYTVDLWGVEVPLSMKVTYYTYCGTCRASFDCRCLAVFGCP